MEYQDKIFYEFSQPPLRFDDAMLTRKKVFNGEILMRGKESGRDWLDNYFVCIYQGGNLVSIETEKEWQFISYEIQKRGNSNTSAWHIGLWKISGDWTCLSGENLSISKWRDSQPDGNDSCAEISKNGGLFNGISIWLR